MENCVHDCFGFSVILIWVAVEFIYVAVLQIVAIVLTIATRKIEMRALNDFKEMVVVTYTSTSVLVFLAVFIFSPLGARYILNELVFNGLVMLATTVFLTSIFVPKVSKPTVSRLLLKSQNAGV